jgi:hypothetical protein
MTRKGGIYEGKKLQRQRRVKEDHPNPRQVQRINTGSSTPFQYQTRSPVPQRQISPLTPFDNEVSSPYFHLKSESIDSPYVLGLEDVQGVYTLDNGPLFSQEQDSHFLNGYSMANNRY